MFFKLRKFGSSALSSRYNIASKTGCSCSGSVTKMGIILQNCIGSCSARVLVSNNYCRNCQYLMVIHDPSLEAISHRLLIAELPSFLSLKNTCTALKYSYKGCITPFSEKY